MTDRDQAAAARLASKAVRVRRLTDPLGAQGFRRTDLRVARETRARRAVFVATLAGFAVMFGLIAGFSRPSPATDLTAAAQPIVAADHTSASAPPARSVRIVTAARPHVQTRSTS